MKLNEKQLEAIKLKIETDKMIPVQAIMGFFREQVPNVSRQLFKKYGKEAMQAYVPKAAKEAPKPAK